MSTRQATSVLVGRDEGEALWWGDGLAVLEVTGKETGGQLSLIEITEPPGYEALLHVHDPEDEGFWVLEGDLELEVGGVRFAAGPGDFAMGPPGVTPSGFEEVVRAMGVPASARTLRTETQWPVDRERAKATAAAHGVAMVHG